MIMLNNVSDPLLFYADSDPEDGMNADPHPGVKISADPKPWLKMLGPERGWAGCRARKKLPPPPHLGLCKSCPNFVMHKAKGQGCGSGSYLDLKAWNPPKNVYFSLTKKNLFNETETNVERTLNKTNTNLPAPICMIFFTSDDDFL